MKKLLAITALTLLTSSAFAYNEVGDAYSGKHASSEKAHSIQMGTNENYGSQLIPQPADHKDGANFKNQQGENESYGSMMIDQPADHLD